MVILADAALFLALSVFVGVHILEGISGNNRPKLRLPSFLIALLAIALIVFSFIPFGMIAEQTASLSQDPFPTALGSVLLDFNIGQGFIVFVLFLAITLIARSTLKEKRWLLLLPILGMILASAWSSHPASLSNLGYFFDVIHMAAAMAWTGVLLVVGFFSTGDDRWLRFFHWFTPFAITMVLLLFASGLGMLTLITPEYTNSWLLSYGQWQLLKHLLFIPLVFYGFAHGFIMKKRLANGTNRTPRFSLRMESAVLAFVFIVTAVMAEQEPPHGVLETLEYTNMSELAMQMITTEFSAGEIVTWNMSFPTFLLIVATGTVLASFIYSVGKMESARFAPIHIVLFVLIAYTGIMLSADVETTTEDTSGESTMEIELLNDTQGTVGDEYLLQAEVTLEGQPIENADVIYFEVWPEEDDVNKGTIIHAEHESNGIYTADYTFAEAANYYVQIHVTADGMHRNPVHEVEVGQ
ncbi:CopD family protein [Salicibibacter cibi]|uniref:CopD family protein n=1 Tax=Salicibibacter cibi TaxID=2743001 RepID=A0A7T6ZD50_9BACI|nr:CopD family protein [Salicibibacter cibi]QQK81085.1 CopD family protein [Salicibibacter cibi]